MAQDISMKNTKKELLEIIKNLQTKNTDEKEDELNPQKVKEQLQIKETTAQAEQIVELDICTHLYELKSSINRELSALADKIEEESKKYLTLKRAIELKEVEIKEVYGIEEEISSLANLLVSHNLIKERFEAEMAIQREQLEKEISETRFHWKAEKNNFEKTLKEENDLREKNRKREEDEFTYNQKRSREIKENNINDELAALEIEIETKRNELEKHISQESKVLGEKEQKLADRETTLNELEKSVAEFPEKLEAEIHKALSNKENELNNNFLQEKALLQQGLEGEQKVLEAQITALESLSKEQAKQIEKLNNQQEKAYKQVQDIAEKAVSGASERTQAFSVRNVEKDSNN